MALQKLIPATQFGTGGLVKWQRAEYTVQATATKNPTWDDTIPQQSETLIGTTISYTPLFSDSILRIEAISYMSATSNTTNYIACLFVDATTDALATFTGGNSSTVMIDTIIGNHHLTSGSTVARTYKIGIAVSASGNVHWNGNASTRKYGGTLISSITIFEFTA